MSLQVAGHQTEGYRIATPVYEGPLDLLLELIERAELDITTLALAQVTDQYLEYMHTLQEQNAAEVSAFLVIAARLVQIKSAALLPRPTLTISGDEEDSGEALAQQLILYKRFKELSAVLLQRDEAGLRTYLRIAPPPLKVEARLDMTGITLDDLVRAAYVIFMNKPNLPFLSQVVTMQRITIREKIQSILTELRRVGSSTFRSLLSKTSTRLEVVITFLAMLELIKRHTVEVQQETIFGDIALQASETLEEIGEDESEFGE